MPNAELHCRPALFQHTAQTLLSVVIQTHIASRLAALAGQEKDLGRFRIQIKPSPIQEQHRQTFAEITGLKWFNQNELGMADMDLPMIMFWLLKAPRQNLNRQATLHHFQKSILECKTYMTEAVIFFTLIADNPNTPVQLPVLIHFQLAELVHVLRK
jgi:hypothetical protein